MHQQKAFIKYYDLVKVNGRQPHAKLSEQFQKPAIPGREGNTRPLNQLIPGVIYIYKYPLCYGTFQKFVLFLSSSTLYYL
jgi:hypothetical protein